MSAAAPWSVKGIDPKAREVAKDLARRSGMTLGEWLNSMIMEDDDDGVTPLPRRAHAAEAVDRRGRARRLDDAYGRDETLDRVAASVDAIAARLEAAERRSTTAIAGIDQAVTGLVRRLDGSDQTAVNYGRRIDDIAEELREGHRRLRRFEQDVGPQTAETFKKVETALGGLAGRLYDMEERQRSSVNELRQRMDVVEREGPQGLLAQVGQRLDQAQRDTNQALKALERSFAGLDDRLRRTETQTNPAGGRFEKLAETLARQVEAQREEMLRRLDSAAAEGRIDKIERAVLAIGDQVQASERRSAASVEAMGKEVLRIAQNLNQRMVRAEAQGERQTEQIGRQVSAKVEQDMTRLGQAIEQRLIRADDQHALAIERLGGEIGKISERLAERISQSERRSQQALEDIGARLVQSSDKIEQRYDRASGELAERMRQSEERTARLLSEARESIERRVSEPRVEPPADIPAAPMAEPVAAPQADWRAAAFPDASFESDAFAAPPFEAEAFDAEAWSGALLDEVAEGSGAQSALPPAASPAPSAQAPAFGSFGGADVSDALEATAPQAPPSVGEAAPAMVSTFGVRADAPGAEDDYSAETDFVGASSLRAGRAQSTRDTIEAARAAMADPATDASSGGFGVLRRGGKSRLQERLDKQAKKEGSTVSKALLASVTAVALTGAVAGYMRLTDPSAVSPGMVDAEATSPSAAPLAANLIAAPRSAEPSEAAALYQQAVDMLNGGQSEGVEVLTRAANLGHAPAQFHLARLYENGDAGLSADLQQTRLWTQRAAEGGEPRAMHNLGMYLFDGVGGARSQAEAVRWFQQAAERGLTDSQYNLGRVFENGAEGVPTNVGEAYKWYLIAGRAGDAQAQEASDRLSAEVSSGVRRRAREAADAFEGAAT